MFPDPGQRSLRGGVEGDPRPTDEVCPVRLAVTCGDPAGIGMEVAWKALVAETRNDIVPHLVGPAAAWEAAKRLVPAAADLPLSPAVETGWRGEQDWAWGRPTAKGAAVAALAVETAAHMALAGEVDAVVTAPLSKQGLQAAGRPFRGHTEMLEHLCGSGHRATMMLLGDRLRVVLVTTHLALSEVPAAVTRGRVVTTILAAHAGLVADLGVREPRIAVAALNPHAGEGGVFGSEERERIVPAIQDTRSRGLRVTGPYPADSLFHRAAEGEFDAVVAMYHDQGLAPLKLLHFHDGVNITLGLPIVRTSPDHGTALEIAGKGVARCDSFRAALRWAATIARRRKVPGEGAR